MTAPLNGMHNNTDQVKEGELLTEKPRQHSVNGPILPNFFPGRADVQGPSPFLHPSHVVPETQNCLCDKGFVVGLHPSSPFLRKPLFYIPYILLFTFFLTLTLYGKRVKKGEKYIQPFVCTILFYATIARKW